MKLEYNEIILLVKVTQYSMFFSAVLVCSSLAYEDIYPPESQDFGIHCYNNMIFQVKSVRYANGLNILSCIPCKSVYGICEVHLLCLSYMNMMYDVKQSLTRLLVIKNI